jgi:hypothetical protein
MRDIYWWAVSCAPYILAHFLFWALSPFFFFVPFVNRGFLTVMLIVVRYALCFFLDHLFFLVVMSLFSGEIEDFLSLCARL